MAIKISNAFITKLQMVSDGSYNIIEDFTGTAGIISGSTVASGGGGVSGDIGGFYLQVSYSPADNNGDITFPDHNASNYTLNPNTMDDGGLYGGYALYINQYDSSGTDKSSYLDSLIGRSGTLTLIQGSNSVTYSFTTSAFSYGGSYSNQYWWDPMMESSPWNGITVTSPASSNFNTTDPISITIT